MSVSDFYQRLETAGYRVLCNPPVDGDCFYAAAAFQLGLETEKVKMMVFNHLHSRRYDVSATTK
jgi:hypothetical protein